MSRSILNRLANDEGIALVVVIGAIALISVFAAGGFALASQAMHSTGRLQTEETAFQVANSGMERELAGFNTSLFESGQAAYQVSGTTPDGAYTVTVGRDPSVSFRYSIISSGTAGTESATVRQDFYYIDLWATNVAAENNPDMGPVGSAAQWNGNSTISGPFYVGGDCDFNSNVAFVGGPLIASGNVQLQGGVSFTPVPAGSKYPLFAGKGCSGAPSNVKVYNSAPKIDLPWVDPDYMDAMRERAKTESSDNRRGSYVDGPDTRIVNAEVTTVGSPGTYTGATAPGAATEYKYVPSSLTINGATASFGKVTKVAGVATEWDDFAYDAATGTLYVEGVVFVEGDVNIGSGVQDYRGSGLIVSTGTINVDTGGSFQPVGGDANPDDLTPTMCLSLVADEDVNLAGCTFEGIVFANGDFNIDMNGVLMGAIHAHTINSLAPHTYLYMETNMSQELLPVGTPGSQTDPREEARAQGQVINGTWSRMQ